MESPAAHLFYAMDGSAICDMTVAQSTTLSKSI